MKGKAKATSIPAKEFKEAVDTFASVIEHLFNTQRVAVLEDEKLPAEQRQRVVKCLRKVAREAKALYTRLAPTQMRSGYYLPSALKQLEKYADALAKVRGIVPNKTLAAQLEPYAVALDTILDALPHITGNQTFDGPCAFNEVIAKAMEHDEKLRDALYLVGYGQLWQTTEAQGE